MIKVIELDWYGDGWSFRGHIDPKEDHLSNSNDGLLEECEEIVSRLTDLAETSSDHIKKAEQLLEEMNDLIEGDSC